MLPLQMDTFSQARLVLTMTRIVTALIGFVALGLALGVQAIIELLLLSYTMYAAGVFVPVVLGLYWSGGTRVGALAGMVVGGAVSAVLALEIVSVGQWGPIVVGSLASLLVYVLISLATPGQEEALKP